VGAAFAFGELCLLEDMASGGGELGCDAEDPMVADKDKQRVHKML